MNWKLFLTVAVITTSSAFAEKTLMDNVKFYSSNYPDPPENVCLGTREIIFVRNPRGAK